MSAVGLFKFVQLAWFSQPRAERLLYKEVRRVKPRRIVEIGMGTAQRAANLIQVAQRVCPHQAVSYTGLDWFEEREAGDAPLPLIHAHRQLQTTAARVRLVPGFPPATLPQVANSLQRSDLVVISAQIDDASLERAWFYVPRMCHASTLVLREQGFGDTQAFAILTVAELQQLAESREARQAA